MSPETKSAQVNLRFAPSLKTAAEEAAARERRSLNSLIESLLADHLSSQPQLEEWHERAQARLLSLRKDTGIPGPIGIAAKSYSIKVATGQQLAPEHLISYLTSINARLHNSFSYAPYFYPYETPGMRPYYTSDHNLGKGSLGEILESFAHPGSGPELNFWRVSPAGLGTDIRPLFEDREQSRNFDLEPGKWLSPFFMTRDLAAFVLHSYYLAEKLPGAEAIEFRCEWSGLKERELAEIPQIGFCQQGMVARVDQRITSGEWPIGDIRSLFPEMVSALGGPVVRLFDPTFAYSPDWVRTQSAKFK